MYIRIIIVIYQYLVSIVSYNANKILSIMIITIISTQYSITYNSYNQCDNWD